MMNDEKCCSLNYEVEWARTKDQLAKAEVENEVLRAELRRKEKQLAFYDGIRQTVEVIFGREYCNA